MYLSFHVSYIIKAHFHFVYLNIKEIIEKSSSATKLSSSKWWMKKVYLKAEMAKKEAFYPCFLVSKQLEKKDTLLNLSLVEYYF